MLRRRALLAAPALLFAPAARAQQRPLRIITPFATGGATDTGGAWTEEPLADGLMRIRRGRECWIVAPNRDGQLDPFNQSTTAKPRAATAC